MELLNRIKTFIRCFMFTFAFNVFVNGIVLRVKDFVIESVKTFVINRILNAWFNFVFKVTFTITGNCFLNKVFFYMSRRTQKSLFAKSFKIKKHVAKVGV